MSPAPVKPPRSIDPDLHDEARSALRTVGAPPVYVELLADVIVRETLHNGGKTLQSADLDDQIAAVDRVIDDLCRAGRLTDSDHDVAMCGSLYRLSCPIGKPGIGGVCPHRYDAGRERRILLRLLRTFCDVEPKIDFGSALYKLSPIESREDFEQVCVRELVAVGRLTPSALIDRDWLLGYADSNSGNLNGDDKNPRRFQYWFVMLEGDVLGAMLPLSAAAPDEEAGRLAWGVLGRLRDLLRFDEVPSRLPKAEHVSAWIAAIEERLSRHPDDLHLAGSLWIAINLKPHVHLDDAARRRLLDFTLRRLSKLRQAVTTATPPLNFPWFGHCEHYWNALHAVQRLGGNWKALKATLLLLRALPELAVGPDLRYWHEPQDRTSETPRPQTPWRWVAETAVGFAYAEHLETDLDDLRSELARYCLERLGSGPQLANKDAKPSSDEEMLEQSWRWRRGYVEAVRELRVNPGHRSHHVLYWLRSNDPNDEVKKLAATAYDEMTNDVLLAPGVSPLRSVLVALLWLRKAHIEHLGLTMDLDGARRTRRKEAEWSKREVKQQT